MQMQSDLFLGWTSIAGRDYVVRQLRDHKASIEDDDLQGRRIWCNTRIWPASCFPKAMPALATPAPSAGYLGKSDRFDCAMANFGIAYATRR